jgi:hypothetical protein
MSEQRQFGHDRFYELLQELADMHENKSHDYSSTGTGPFDNFMSSQDFNVSPILGVLIRAGDKWARIKSMIKTGINMVREESLIDTLKDMASYCLIVVILIEEHNRASEDFLMNK